MYKLYAGPFAQNCNKYLWKSVRNITIGDKRKMRCKYKEGMFSRPFLKMKNILIISKGDDKRKLKATLLLTLTIRETFYWLRESHSTQKMYQHKNGQL